MRVCGRRTQDACPKPRDALAWTTLRNTLQAFTGHSRNCAAFTGHSKPRGQRVLHERGVKPCRGASATLRCGYPSPLERSAPKGSQQPVKPRVMHYAGYDVYIYIYMYIYIYIHMYIKLSCSIIYYMILRGLRSPADCFRERAARARLLLPHRCRSGL